jgi:ADP-heptose:LPS heptosyltransferase
VRFRWLIMSEWCGYKNILCVRLDNMGDLLMSSPAMAALKESFSCKITVLTSSMATEMAKNIPVIDDVLTWDAPWIKNESSETESIAQLISLLKSKKFDASVIFTVFSQNPLPAAMLLMMAEIPQRLAYCRENPYNLLTSWVPDKEPYSFVQHQVERDLALVKSIGASTEDDRLRIYLRPEHRISVRKKLNAFDVEAGQRWLVLHPGVSEKKREYPVEQWISIAKKLVKDYGCRVLLSGSQNEIGLTKQIVDSIGGKAFSCAGLFTLEEFIALISMAPVVISVNTSTIHIAAATATRVIVLYALTNPQHTPWRAQGSIFPYSVNQNLRSRNAILEFVEHRYFAGELSFPDPHQVARTAFELLTTNEPSAIPHLFCDPGEFRSGEQWRPEFDCAIPSPVK